MRDNAGRPRQTTPAQLSLILCTTMLCLLYRPLCFCNVWLATSLFYDDHLSSSLGVPLLVVQLVRMRCDVQGVRAPHRTSSEGQFRSYASVHRLKRSIEWFHIRILKARDSTILLGTVFAIGSRSMQARRQSCSDMPFIRGNRVGAVTGFKHHQLIRASARRSPVISTT
jgi:hypothetical protein